MESEEIRKGPKEGMVTQLYTLIKTQTTHLKSVYLLYVKSTLQIKKLYRHLESHRNLIFCFWTLGTEGILSIKERFSQKIKKLLDNNSKYRLPNREKQNFSFGSII